MATSKRVFTMRMQPENFDKIRVIAALNKRSAAMQIEYLIEQCINNYESHNGKIAIADNDDKKSNFIVNNQVGNSNLQMVNM